MYAMFPGMWLDHVPRQMLLEIGGSEAAVVAGEATAAATGTLYAGIANSLVI